MRRRMLRQELDAGGAAEAVNVTPMIDVVMVLIVFFLIVGKLAADQGPTVRLPGSKAGLTQSQPPAATIVIAPGTESGPKWGGVPARVSVDGTEVPDEAALEALLRDRMGVIGGKPVQVRADRGTVYAPIEPVLRACSKAGLTNLRLATERVR